MAVLRAPASVMALVLLLGGSACAAGDQPAPGTVRPSAASSDRPDPEAHHAAGAARAARPVPLRAGEERLTVTMPAPYRPSAPTASGSDDYRCFLLDPGLDREAYLTGTTVLPGNPEVVHHVILFQVPPHAASRAEALDAADDGEGWTCFGGPGTEVVPSLDDAPWLGAWAPGTRESVHPPGYGVPMQPGTKIVMQVHYNLQAGAGEDVSATQLRLAPADAGLAPLHTMLLPAPVELPCRPEHAGGPLCDRDAALADVQARFGRAGGTADALYFLCGGGPRPGPVQSCSRTVDAPTTVLGVAGHMHLLGRSIRVEANPGTPRAKTLLDVPVWDFDDQGSRRVTPLRLAAGDTVRVTCRHAQWLRDELPAFDGQPDRYVLWGEGTTDEMCLGILQVARP